MKQFHNRFYWGLGGNATIILILALVNVYGLFSSSNNLFADFFARYGLPSFGAEQRSLVIECSRDQLNQKSQFWNNLVLDLKNKGARQIIFLFPHGLVSDIPQASWLKDDRLFYASSDYWQAQQNCKVEMPVTGQSTAQSGPILLPPPENGIYRSQYAAIPEPNGAATPHLVRIATERLLSSPYRGLDQFGVNFIGRKVGSQPKINLQLVLSGNLIKSLVAGRTVFIGLAPQAPYPGLFTPLEQGRTTISPAIYTAYAYDSLVNGKTIRLLGPMAALMLFILFISAGTFTTQFMRAGLAIFSAFFMFIVILLSSWFSYCFFQQLLPVAELLFGQFLLILLIIYAKALLSEEKVSVVAFNTRQKVQERLLPSDLYVSQQYWLQVVGMVSQLLNLSRSIFLEKIPGDTRVREVAADNTSINDINERRRDYSRFPYTEALDEDGPVEVDGYLPSWAEDEHQFLTPLRITGGSVLGFWACSISSEQKIAQPDLVPLLNTFASQISEMLYAREQLQSEQRLLQNPIRKMLTLEAGDEKYEEIYNAFFMLSKRLNTVEKVFDSMRTGAILYDLFGQVIYANQKIVSLLQELENSPYQLSASELIAILTGQELNHVRVTLSDIFFHGSSLSMYTQELGSRQQSYLLTVKTVTDTVDSRESVADSSATAFDIIGIFLEISEVTDLRKILKQKEAYFQYNSRDFADYRISLQTALQRLGREHSSPENREKLVNFLGKRLETLFERLDSLEEVGSFDMLDPETPYFPIDLAECIRQAVRNVEIKAGRHKLRFELKLSERPEPVLADPVSMEEACKKILIFLIQDAKSPSTLTIGLHRDQRALVCTMENQGYGLPDHDFQNYLEDIGPGSSPEFRSLAEARDQILHFGGEFHGHSELDRGTKIVIKLKKFSMVRQKQEKSLTDQ